MDYLLRGLVLCRVRQPRLKGRHPVGGQRAASDPLNQDVSQTSCVSRRYEASAGTCWEDHLYHLFVFLSEDLQVWARLSTFWGFRLWYFTIDTSCDQYSVLSFEFIGFICRIVEINL